MIITQNKYQLKNWLGNEHSRAVGSINHYGKRLCFLKFVIHIKHCCRLLNQTVFFCHWFERVYQKYTIPFNKQATTVRTTVHSFLNIVLCAVFYPPIPHTYQQNNFSQIRALLNTFKIFRWPLLSKGKSKSILVYFSYSTLYLFCQQHTHKNYVIRKFSIHNKSDDESVLTRVQIERKKKWKKKKHAQCVNAMKHTSCSTVSHSMALLCVTRVVV